MKKVNQRFSGFSRDARKKGQVTIFIIVAIVVVGGIVAYFVLRDGFGESIPEDLRPVYDYYVSCLEASAQEGISLLGEQGGRIEIPEFEPGSAYMPFSSQLDFLGQAVPYWMYVSGNNFLRERVPKKMEMENELAAYVVERIVDLKFGKDEKEEEKRRERELRPVEKKRMKAEPILVGESNGFNIRKYCKR